MPLPSFIIAGERRCGTSSLAKVLAQHPEIFVHPKGDSGYFIDDTVRTNSANFHTNWSDSHSKEQYRDWFASTHVLNQNAIGEKSADYLYWKESHSRIAQFVPDVKLIIILRDPVERAWSHYWNEVAKGREKLTFENAINKEPERVGNSAFERYMFSYVSRGDYAASLVNLFKFFDRKNVFVTSVEQLRSDPKSTLESICNFLNVDEGYSFSQLGKKHNVNWAVYPKPWARGGLVGSLAKGYSVVMRAVIKRTIKDRTRRREWIVKTHSPFFSPAKNMKMLPSTKKQLTDHFRPRINELANLLHQDFSLWGVNN